MNEIKTKALTAKLDDSNNTWHVLRLNGHKIGVVNTTFDGVYFTNPHTPIDANELNAIVSILDVLYENNLKSQTITNKNTCQL